MHSFKSENFWHVGELNTCGNQDILHRTTLEWNSPPLPRKLNPERIWSGFSNKSSKLLERWEKSWIICFTFSRVNPKQIKKSLENVGQFNFLNFCVNTVLIEQKVPDFPNWNRKLFHKTHSGTKPGEDQRYETETNPWIHLEFRQYLDSDR